MGFMKKHRKAIIAWSLAGTIGLGGLVGSMGYMSSLYETIYYALTGTEVIHTEVETPPDLQPYTGPYYDAIHEGICNLDMSKIPDNAELGLGMNDFVIDGWTLKSYLQVYKLFAEICARPEINPPNEVQITPADLFGMMLNEGGTQTYSMFTNYLQWQTGSDNQYWGPFEQDKTWSEINKVSDNAYGAIVIYISWEENPTLPMKDRVVWGLPGDIKNGQGILVNEDTFAQLRTDGSGAFRKNTVDAKSLQSKMKVGIISGGNQNTESRPNSRFFPDAAYGQAFNMRLALSGINRSTLTKVSSGGHAVDKFASFCSKTGMAGNLENATKALAMTLNSGAWDYTKIGATLAESGGLVKAYQKMADSKDINFVAMTKVKESDRKLMLNYPGLTDWNLLWDYKATSAVAKESFTYPSTGLMGKYGIAAEVASFMQPLKSWEVWQCTFYGYRAVNNGYEFNRVVTKICEYAISHDEWKYDKAPTLPPGVENPDDSESGGSGSSGGNGSTGGDAGSSDPLPAGPADKTCTAGHGYCAKALTGRITDKTSGFVLANENIPSCGRMESMMSGVKPVSCYGTTYSNHIGIDYPLATGTAVGASQEGYIIAIGAYPRNTYVGLNVNPSGVPESRWAGNFVTIAHNGGYTVYAHLSDFAHIRIGQYVSKGEIIAYSGNSGNSSGPHLHVSWGTTKYLGIAGWLPGNYQYPRWGY